MKYFAKIILLTLCLISTSCEQATTQPDDGYTGPAGVVAAWIHFYPEAGPPALADSVLITVTGDDMDPTIYKLGVDEYGAKDTLYNVPAGSARQFTIELFDIEEALCYSGEATLDIYQDSIVNLFPQMSLEPTRGFRLNKWEVEDLAVTSAGVIFCGTYGLGLIMSADGGVIWYRKNSVQTWGDFVKKVKLGPDGNIYTSGRPAYFSNDGGNSWIDMGFEGYVSDFAFDKTGAIYAGSSQSVYKSVDGGNSWSENKADSVMDRYGIRALAVDDTGQIFVGGSNGMTGRFFRYTPADNQWTALQSTNEFKTLVVGADGLLVASFTTSDESGGGISISTDWGTTWTYNSDLHYYSVTGPKINSAGTVYAGLTGGDWSTKLVTSGVYQYDATADDWIMILEEVPYGLAISPIDNIWAVLDDGTVVLSTDDGATWINYDMGQ